MTHVTSELDPREQALVERFSALVVRYGLTVPAILALESLRPLAYTGSQFMHMLTPALGAVLSSEDWEVLAGLLERREGLEQVLRGIEAADAKR